MRTSVQRAGDLLPIVARSLLAIALAACLCAPAPALAAASGQGPGSGEQAAGAQQAGSAPGEAGPEPGGGSGRAGHPLAAAAPAPLQAGPAEPGREGRAAGEPTVTVEVRERGGESWSHAANGLVGQAVDVLVTATLPDDLDEYPSYNMQITVAMAGFEAVAASGATVAVDGEDVSAQLRSGRLGSLYTSQGEVGAGFYDVLQAGASGGSVVELAFEAALAGASQRERVTGELRAFLDHTADKEGLGTKSELEAEPGARVYTYTARVHASDNVSGLPLPGVGYTAKAGRRFDGAFRYMYAQGDGTWSAEPHVFVSADDGAVDITGLGTEEYTVEQVQAPPGYAVHPGGFKLAVAPELDGDAGTVRLLQASATGNMGVAVTDADASSGAVDVAAPAGRLADGPAAPTATMRLKGPADASWTSVTQTFAFRYVDFEAAITLPGDVCEYPKYYFWISLYALGMQIDGGSVTVELDGRDVTSDLVGNPNGNLQRLGDRLNFRLYGLLGVFGAASGGSVLKVGYRARNAPSSSAVSQTVGRGFASLSYHTDPASASTYGSATTPYLAKVYTHSAGITALDASTGAPLRNKYFAVRVVECADAEAVGKYVSEGGTAEESRTTFHTGDDGRVNLPGLDSGTYAIEELLAPSGYAAQGEATFTIDAGLDSRALSVASFSATAGGGNARVESADASTWRAEIVIGSDKRLKLPVTGLAGTRDAALASAALAVAGLAGAALLPARRRRHGKGAPWAHER